MSKLDITIYDLFCEKGDICYVLVDIKKINEYINLAKALEAELDDYKHNYKALKEFYDNSVAYGSKIQNELNTLKKDAAIYKDTLDSIKFICNEPSPSMILSLTEICKRYVEIDKLINTYDEIDNLINTYDKKLSKVGKEE